MNTNSPSNIDLSKNNEVVEFIDTNVRKNYSFIEYNWQYGKRNIYGGFYYLKEKKIFASQGMIYFPIITNQEEVISVKSETSYLSKEYRGKGLFEKIYFDAIEDCRNQNVQLVWGFTLLDQVWKNKLGFKCDNVFYEGRIVISPFNLYKNSSYSPFKKVLQFAKNCFSSLRTAHKIKDSSLLISQIKYEDNIQEVSELFSKWMAKYPEYICLNISTDFLRWRIINNPKCKYEILMIKDQEQNNIGFTICNVSEQKIYISELVILKEIHIKETLEVILSYYRNKKGLDAISYLGNIRNPYNKFIFENLNSFGASINELKEMKFVFKSISELDLESNINKYVLNGLWTEGFKI